MSVEKRPQNPFQSYHDRLNLLNITSDTLAEDVRKVRESQKTHPETAELICEALITGKKSGKHQADVYWVSALSEKGLSSKMIEEIWDIRNRTEISIDPPPAEKK